MELKDRIKRIIEEQPAEEASIMIAYLVERLIISAKIEHQQESIQQEINSLKKFTEENFKP